MNEPLPSYQPQSKTSATKPKGNGLAVTGLVLACLFFIPILPTIGLILGIVSLVTGRHRTISIVAICLGAFFTLFIGIEVAVAIPAFMKYAQRAKSVEATASLNVLGKDILALDASAWSKLPDSDWTPAGSACNQAGGKFAPDAQAWQAEPWRTIGFSVDRASHYQYRVRRSTQGFIVEAQGDLDCKGVMSHFSREVAPDGVGELRRENDRE